MTTEQLPLGCPLLEVVAGTWMVSWHVNATTSTPPALWCWMTCLMSATKPAGRNISLAVLLITFSTGLFTNCIALACILAVLLVSFILGTALDSEDEEKAYGVKFCQHVEMWFEITSE